jgi:uncharacterized RDD family membrane protein YckC
VGDQAVASGQARRQAVGVFGSVEVAGEVSRDAVAVVGSAFVRPGGSVGGSLVSVLGSAEQRGRVGGDVVVVIGDALIDGPVGGQVVVVGGTLELGPSADLRQGYVLVGGQLRRDAAAKVAGQEVSVISSGAWSGFSTWVRSCLFWGRPLAFREGLGWAWWAAAAFAALYLLVALLFPRPVERAVGTLEARPGLTLVATILTVLCTPLVLTVLSISVVGLVLVPVLALGLLAALLLGQAAFRVWLGRRLLKVLGGTGEAINWSRVPPQERRLLKVLGGTGEGMGSALMLGGTGEGMGSALIAGSALVLLLYTVPLLGFALVFTLAWLSTGVMVLTAALALRRAPAAPAGVPAAGPAPAVESPPVAGAYADPAVLPRAGFLVRSLALALDVLVVGSVVALMHAIAPAFLLVLAAYGAVLWRLRGATLGGMILGLRVVRTDGKDVDWTTAGIRALSCFLSLLPLGLGFLWIAFDRDRQAWHDKVAGTVVIRVPRGVSLA